MSTLKEDLNTYSDLMEELKADLAKAADVLAKDYGTGVSHQNTSAIGFVLQPLARFDIKTQFDILTPVLSVNSAVISFQGKSLKQVLTTCTNITEHFWVQASKLISLQAGSHHRGVLGEDYCYAKDYFRQSATAVQATGYQKLQVTKSAFKAGDLGGVAGRYDLKAEESINMQAEGYLVGRATKDVLFTGDAVKMQAQKNFSVSAGGVGQVSATGALSLSGAVTNISSLGIAKVSAGGILSLDGSLVHINMGAAGVASRSPLNLDALDKLSSLGITDVLANAATIATLATQIKDGNVLGALVSTVGIAGSLPGVGDSLKVLEDVSKFAADPFGAVVDLGLGQVKDLLGGVLPTKLADFVGDALDGPARAAVTQMLEKSPLGPTAGAVSSWASYAGVTTTPQNTVVSVQSSAGEKALSAAADNYIATGAPFIESAVEDFGSAAGLVETSMDGMPSDSTTTVESAAAADSTAAAADSTADSEGSSELPPPPVFLPIKPYSSVNTPPTYPQQPEGKVARVEKTASGDAPVRDEPLW